MEGTKTYRLEVAEKIWKEFRNTLKKDDVINKVITEMIIKRIEDFKKKNIFPHPKGRGIYP